jgi:hypothetical protein
MVQARLPDHVLTITSHCARSLDSQTKPPSIVHCSLCTFNQPLDSARLQTYDG